MPSISFILLFSIAIILLPANDKPHGFFKEEREMWWNLVRDCTHQNPNERPDMPYVLRLLEDIFKIIQGINIFCYCCFFLVFNIKLDFKCKKHGKLSHHVFISYHETDKNILFTNVYIKLFI